MEILAQSSTAFVLHTIFRALIYWAHRAVVLAIAWHLVSFVIVLVFVSSARCNFYFYIAFVSQIVIILVFVLIERSVIILVFVFTARQHSSSYAKRCISYDRFCLTV